MTDSSDRCGLSGASSGASGSSIAKIGSHSASMSDAKFPVGAPSVVGDCQTFCVRFASCLRVRLRAFACVYACECVRVRACACMQRMKGCSCTVRALKTCNHVGHQYLSNVPPKKDTHRSNQHRAFSTRAVSVLSASFFLVHNIVP